MKAVLHLNYRDGRPIYEQVKEGLRQLVISGAIRPGDKLPSVRSMAAQLAINPNTIQKAFRLLEDEGLISSRTGSKSCVCLSDQQSQAMQQQLPNTQTLEYIEKMRAMGLTRSQTIALIETLWKEDVP